MLLARQDRAPSHRPFDCDRCGRAGRYRRGRLIERFGADAALPGVVTAIIPAFLGSPSP